jgi:hypothetical protein
VIHDGVLTVLSSLRPVTTGMVLVRVFEVPPFLVFVDYIVTGCDDMCG